MGLIILFLFFLFLFGIFSPQFENGGRERRERRTLRVRVKLRT